MLKSRSNWKRNLFIICALIPPMLVSMGLVMYPMISTVIRSFKNPETGELTFSNYVYLFTNTVSHKMVRCALSSLKGEETIVERSHSSSIAALRNILDIHAPRV